MSRVKNNQAIPRERDIRIFRKEVVLWFGVLSFFLVLYNNCSKQNFRFAPTEESLRTALNTGGILIEGGNEFTQTQNVQLQIFSELGNQMYITNDPTCTTGGVWEDYQDIKNWNLPRTNQNVSVHARFKDQDGVLSDCLSDSIIHDNVAPFVEYTNKPDKISRASQSSFLVEASDNLSGVTSYFCSDLQEGPFEKCEARFTRLHTQSGYESIYVKAQDGAGNLSEPFPYYWIFDNTPPTLEIVQAPAQFTSQTSTVFRLSGQDNLTGIAYFNCASESNGFSKCNQDSFALSNLPEGRRKVRFQAVDGAGNVSNTLEYSWTVDRTAPTVRITKGPRTHTNQINAEFEFEATAVESPIQEIQCSFDNSSFAPCTSPLNYSRLSEGRHEFRVQARDVAGNTSSPVTWVWYIDTTAPIVTLTEVPARYTNQRSASFRFEISESGSGIAQRNCTLSGVSVNCDSNSLIQSNLNEGNQRFTVQVADLAGNVSSPVEYQWTIDVTRPEVEIIRGPEVINNLSQGTLEFIGRDELSGIDPNGYMCRLNSGSFEPCTSPKSYSGLSEGPQIFLVQARDRAGNLSDQPAEHRWTVDRTGPEIAFVKLPLNHDESASATISYRVTDQYSEVRQVRCGINMNEAICGAEDEVTFASLAPGEQVFRVVAEDALGNISSREHRWTVLSLFEQKTEYLAVNPNNDVDILFVVDNSGSMAPIQNELANRLNGFISKIDGLNWQIALTTTDTRSNTRFNSQNVPWGDGQLRPFGNTVGFVLRPYHSNPQSLLETAVTVGTQGSGDERGLYANYRLIERATAANSPYYDFIRSKAALTTILISDEDECSNGCSSSVSNANKSVPEELASLIEQRFGQEKLFVFNSIIVRPGDSACKASSHSAANYGNTYQRLTNLTDGIVGSICAPDYTTQLMELGDKVTSLTRTVQLECAPVDVDGNGMPNLEVTLEDGSSVPSFTISGRLVTFSVNIPAGNHKFEYTCRK